MFFSHGVTKSQRFHISHAHGADRGIAEGAEFKVLADVAGAVGVGGGRVFVVGVDQGGLTVGFWGFVFAAWLIPSTGGLDAFALRKGFR